MVRVYADTDRSRGQNLEAFDQKRLFELPQQRVDEIVEFGVALHRIDHLPYPEQLYLEVCGLIFREKEESPD